MESSTQPVATQSSETPRAPPRGLYQCGVCKKEYTRADHLIRHVRSHTADKPFSCQVCGKGFSRIDLLRRHAQGHPSNNGDNGDNASPGIRARVSKACKSCASSKLKCDDEKPCRRCVRRNQICQWSQRENSFEELHTAESDISPGERPEQEEIETSPIARELQATRQCNLNEGASFLSNAGHEAPGGLIIANTNNGESSGLLQYDSCAPAIADLGVFPLTNRIEWNMDDCLGLDFSLTDEDLEVLGSLARPSHLFHIPGQSIQRNPNPGVESSSDNMNSDDFNHSPLAHWTPRVEDNAYMDEQYLSVPEHLDTPNSQRAVRTRIFTEHLSKESRDAVFSVVVAICQRKGPLRIMKCFPSAELLDSLIQDFFKQQRSEIDPFIHESTMELNKESPEMILTLAAAGAVLSSVEAIQRLGYAILEIARLSVNSKYEDQNVLTRDLKQQQQYVLILQIGLWSGDKRRIEIAESFVQPIVTMLRRASRFKYETYPAIIPDAADDDSIISCKWHEWVEHESFKRLVHRIFLHDVQASLLRSTNPIMSHAELDLPLPLSRSLWDAKTATEWKSCYVQEISTGLLPMPSFATTLQDISILSRFPKHGDLQLAALATVHGISTMIMDCNHTRRGPSGQWSEVVMKIWQQELQQVLEQFEIFAVEPLHKNIPSLALIYQMVSLSLYMPTGVLETFAGKDGEKRSSDIYQAVIQHISPMNLRKAAWHAGQVLRIARSMPSSQFSAFCATCLYFAALTLWALSTLRPTNFLNQDAGINQSGAVFLLDGEYAGAALQRFIISGQSAPFLKHSGENVPLSDRAGVMRVFQQALESKQHGGCYQKQTRALYYMLTVLGAQNRAKSTLA